MGKKTHGPYLIAAIEKNDHQKVHEILAKEIKNKEKIREVCTSAVKRLASEFSEVPLILAAQLPDPSIIQYMVGNHGVDVNFIFKEQVGRKVKVKTALILAVRRGNYDTVEAILAMNADPNIQDHKGRSALHHAVRKADYRMAKMLVVRGAQASLTDKGDNTPLHVASIFGHVELAKMLIYYGADLYKKGQLGAIPIHIAAKEGHVSMLSLFGQHDINPNIKMPCYDGREKAALHVAAEEGHFECVLALVTLGADINLGDSEGESPLHCSVLHEYDPMGMKSKDDYTETVKVILRSGANVNMQNGRGETALHLAARNQFQKILEILLQSGADPLIEDNSGDKPIDLVDEQDAVSRQILKQVMENREQYMSDLFEIQAKGFSTSANPLNSRSVSMDMLSSKESILGKAASTLGLMQHPFPRQSTSSSIPPDEEYLQPLSSHNNISSPSLKVDVHPQPYLNGPDMTAQNDNTYAKIDDDNPNAKQDLRKGKDNSILPKFLKGKSSQESLLERKASMLESSDSSQFEDESKRNIKNQATTSKVANGFTKIEALQRSNSNKGRSLPSPPPSGVRDSILSTSTDMTDMSSVWAVTPRQSVAKDFGVSKTTGDLMSKLRQDLQSRRQNFLDSTTTQYETLPDEKQVQAIKKGLSTFAPEPPKNPPPPMEAPKTGTKIVYAEDNESEEDDSYFDDESFETVDTLSEATMEMVENQRQKTGGANQSVPKAEDSHVENWLNEQASLLVKRKFDQEGPLAQSTPPGSKIYASRNQQEIYENFTSVSEQAATIHPKKHSKLRNVPRPVPPPRPPKLERSPSTSSVDSQQKHHGHDPSSPKGKKRNKSRSVSESSESTLNAVQFEVDQKKPGQTVIKILPVQKPAVPKNKPKVDLSKDYHSGNKFSTDNKINLQLSSGKKQPSSFDTASEVSSYTKSSSKIKRKPSQRVVVDRSGVSRVSVSGSSMVSFKMRKRKESEESFDVGSVFTDQDEDVDEEPNTGHYTAGFFENVTQENIITQEPKEPKIKMTFASVESQNTHIIDVKKKPDVPVIKPLPRNPPAVTTENNKEQRPVTPPTIKPSPQVTPQKPEIKPALRPKPVPRTITPVQKPEDIVIEDLKCPVPKPRNPSDSKISKNENPDIVQEVKEIEKEKIVKDEPEIPKESIPELEIEPTQRKKSPKVVSVDKKPEAKSEINQAAKPLLKIEQVNNDLPSEKSIDEPLPSQTVEDQTNNNDEKKKTTKKKVKKKGAKTKKKDKTGAKAIKIEKVEKVEETEEPLKTEELMDELPSSASVSKPESKPVPLYAAVNKEAKSKPKPSVVEDSDTSSSGRDENPPATPIKLVDPYLQQEGVKPQMPIKLEDPYATVSLVENIRGRQGRPPNKMVVHPDPGYEAPPDIGIQPMQPVELQDSPKTRKVTIGSKQFIPNHTKKPKGHDHRQITYMCGGKIDFDIIGGNSEGVFIYNIEPGSDAENAGLKVGDKILKIDELSVLGKTKEEVYLILKGVKNILSLVVRYKYELYKHLIDSGGLGDAFHIRAHLTYRAQRNGEMNIVPGDIFLIQDSLPNGQYGFWRACKVNAGPRDQQYGLIPNQQKAEQIGLDSRMAQLKEFEKEKGGFLKRGFKRSKSLDRVALKKSQEDLNLNARNKIAYERIEHRVANFPRPILLLGLFCDVVRDMLARESPGIFHVPSNDIEVPTTNSSGAIEPIDEKTLRAIIQTNKHCLTIVSPKGIEYMQNNTDFHPMVIYLAPGHKSILKIVKSKLSPSHEKGIGYLYDQSMSFERQYEHLFTATVTYTSDDSWYSLLKDTIHRIQNQPQWQTVSHFTKPDNSDTEDEESEDDTSKLLNRSVDNIPAQIMQYNKPPINNPVTPTYMDSPTSQHSNTNSLNGKPKSILKVKSDTSFTSSQVSDTESSSSSVTKQPIYSGTSGSNIIPQNKHVTMQGHPRTQSVAQMQSHPMSQPHAQSQGHPRTQSVANVMQPTNQVQGHPRTQSVANMTQPTHPVQGHPRTQSVNHLDNGPTQGQKQPSLVGFHPAFASVGLQPPVEQNPHNSKETVL